MKMIDTKPTAGSALRWSNVWRCPNGNLHTLLGHWDDICAWYYNHVDGNVWKLQNGRWINEGEAKAFARVQGVRGVLFGDALLACNLI